MYLYEHQNWTEFTWDEGEILPLLGDARFAQGKILGRVQDLGFAFSSQAELSALSQEIIASSKIEGVELNAKSVRSSVARNLGLEHPDSFADTHQVDGAVSITLDATKNFDKPLTFQRLAGWHNALFPAGYSGLRKIDVAQYRSGSMNVVSGPIGHEKIHYNAPDADLVPKLMDEFLLWINERADNWLLKAAIAHLWFLTIHPFDDGNGRIARAITEMCLARSDGSPRRFYNMAHFILKNRKSYYDVLERVQKGTPNITEWLEWFFRALIAAIGECETIIDDVVRQNAWWRSIDDIVLNARQKSMLQRMLGNFEGKLTARKWAKICKVSHDTALRDINDLMDKGILVRSGTVGGRSTAYELRNSSTVFL